GLVRAGVHHETGRLVIRNLRVNGADPADIVGDLAQVWPQLADVHPALSILLELERGLHEFAGTALGLDRAARKRLSVVPFQGMLGVEAVDSGAAPVHEKENDPLDALGIVKLGDPDVSVRIEYRAGAGKGVAEHSGKCHHAEAVAHPA